MSKAMQFVVQVLQWMVIVVAAAGLAKLFIWIIQ